MPTNIEDRPVIDNEAKSQFEVQMDGKLAILQYTRTEELVTYFHTAVPRELESRGTATWLARHALDDARRRGLKVIPKCPFVGAFISRHPEYADLVDRTPKPEPVRKARVASTT